MKIYSCKTQNYKQNFIGKLIDCSLPEELCGFEKEFKGYVNKRLAKLPFDFFCKHEKGILSMEPTTELVIRDASNMQPILTSPNRFKVNREISSIKSMNDLMDFVNLAINLNLKNVMGELITLVKAGYEVKI